MKATPVDTGYARSNWIAGTGRPLTAPVGSKKKVNTNKQREKLAQLRNYRIRDGSIYIVNNCPYIGMLNRGSSTRVQAGFVEEILNRVIGEANKASILKGF